MIQALDDNGWTLAGKTETWDAVILFLVTDGNPTDDAGNPNKPSSFISLDYNTQFPGNYVDIVILMIDPHSSIDTSKIECLDYFDNGTDVIEIESFNSASFTDIESRLQSM